MKKIIFLIILFVSQSIFALQKRAVGPILSKFTVNRIAKNGDNSPLIINKFPKLGIYQLRTLDQGFDGTCTVHSLKNMLWATRAFSCLRMIGLYATLPKIFNKSCYVALRNFLTNYLKCNIIKDGMSDTEFTQAINRLLKLPKNLKIWSHLPKNINPLFFSRVMIFIQMQQKYMRQNPTFFNRKYAKISKRFAPVDLIFDKEKAIKMVYDFRKSNRKVLGLTLYCVLDGEAHAISVLIRKVNNRFEYFIMDSNNLKQRRPYWLNGFLRIKLLFDITLKTLHGLVLAS